MILGSEDRGQLKYAAVLREMSLSAGTRSPRWRRTLSRASTSCADQPGGAFPDGTVDADGTGDAASWEAMGLADAAAEDPGETAGWHEGIGEAAEGGYVQAAPGCARGDGRGCDTDAGHGGDAQESFAGSVRRGPVPPYTKDRRRRPGRWHRDGLVGWWGRAARSWRDASDRCDRWSGDLRPETTGPSVAPTPGSCCSECTATLARRSGGRLSLWEGRSAP